MGVEALAKPPGAWCAHCDRGVGCSIYDDRPQSCRDFRCLWLSDPSIPQKMRPDRSKVVLEADAANQRIVAWCDPANPLAWAREPLRSSLRRQAAAGWSAGRHVIAIAGRRTWIITPNGEIDLGEIDPQAPIVMAERADGSFTAEVLAPPET